jgi:hypothetical protein
LFFFPEREPPRFEPAPSDEDLLFPPFDFDPPGLSDLCLGGAEFCGLGGGADCCLGGADGRCLGTWVRGCEDEAARTGGCTAGRETRPEFRDLETCGLTGCGLTGRVATGFDLLFGDE